ncbi:MAG: response regulator, partial [Hyphomicrobiales bacterium]|nr:response regulator [Hyphomicrobiales bacterium]
MWSHSNASILIVQNDTPDAHATESMLLRLGYEVTASTEDAAGALLALKTRRPNIVLLDLSLGADTSLLVAKRCRKLGVLIVCTSDDPASQVGPTYGDAPMLLKPFGLEGLRLALK